MFRPQKHKQTKEMAIKCKLVHEFAVLEIVRYLRSSLTQINAPNDFTSKMVVTLVVQDAGRNRYRL